MGLLNKIFKKKKKQYSEDDYVRSSYIYSTNHVNYIFLLSFTDNYFPSVAEFLACNKSLIVKLIQSSIDQETDKVDEDGYPIILSKNVNYLLVGGDASDYCKVYNNISISNEILSALTTEIYEYINSEYFTDLIKDNVLNKDLFKDYTQTDNIVKQYKDSFRDTVFIYDPADYILSKLPSIFSGADILPFIKIHTNKLDFYTSADFINKVKDDNLMKVIFNGIVKHPTHETLQYLLEPLYKLTLDDDETLHGSIDQVQLDEIFQQEYDRFNAVVNDEMSYVDIDEVLNEDDPEYSEVDKDE